MNRILRILRVLLLYTGVLAIIAHMIIPHDHHNSDAFIIRHDYCPFANENSTHQPGIPVHCHVCNDLVTEKAVTFLVARNINCVSHIICFDDKAEIRLFTAQCSLADKTPPLLLLYLTNSSLLRAPPDLV